MWSRDFMGCSAFATGRCGPNVSRKCLNWKPVLCYWQTRKPFFWPRSAWKVSSWKAICPAYSIDIVSTIYEYSSEQTTGLSTWYQSNELKCTKRIHTPFHCQNWCYSLTEKNTRWDALSFSIHYWKRVEEALEQRVSAWWSCTDLK